MKMIVIESGGPISVRDVVPTLENMQQLVGGDLQAILFSDGASAYVNEDGKGLKLPENARATLLCELYDVGLAQDDNISGNMVIVGSPDEDGNDTEVPQKLIDEIAGLLSRPRMHI